jgi:hypothetical protein
MTNNHEKRRADRMAPDLLAFPLGWFRLYLHPAIGQGDIFPFQLGCHFP